MSWDIWSSMPEEIANQMASGFIGASRVGGDKWLSKVRLFFIINLTLLWLYPPYTCITLIKNKILIKIPASIMILHLLPLKILTNNAAIQSNRNEHMFKYFLWHTGEKGMGEPMAFCTQPGSNDLISHLGFDEIQWLSWTWSIFTLHLSPLKQEDTAVGV